MVQASFGVYDGALCCGLSSLANHRLHLLFTLILSLLLGGVGWDGAGSVKLASQVNYTAEEVIKDSSKRLPAETLHQCCLTWFFNPMNQAVSTYG